MRSESWFAKLDRRVARASGRPLATTLAFTVIIVWLATGPIFHYSDTWQLVVNTGTSVITFIMVFLIQGSQNLDTEALQTGLNAQAAERKKTLGEILVDREKLA